MLPLRKPFWDPVDKLWIPLLRIMAFLFERLEQGVDMSVLENGGVGLGDHSQWNQHHACACRHSGFATATFGGPGAENHYPPSLEIEPVHLLIELKLDLDA